jgi:transmembrane sensor
MLNGSEQDVADEALGWIARIETGDLSPADRAALKEWMRRSPRHAAEIRAAAALSAELSCLTELLEPLAMEVRNTGPRAAYRPGLVAAAAALVAIVLSVGIYATFFSVQTVHEFYATAAGEYTTRTLADGSTLRLNSNSAVEVIYDRQAREIRLIQGGAYFDVAKNHSWPFIVYAGATSARAVGTAFSVDLYKDETVLIVQRGTVAFSRLAAATEPAAGRIARNQPKPISPARPVFVTAGYQLSSTPAGTRQTVEKLTPAEERQKFSWTKGYLDFSDTPLSEVVNEVSRHTAMRIEIADPVLRDVKFGGVFPLGDTSALLNALPRVGVVVQRVNENEVRLYSESNQNLHGRNTGG